MKLIIDIPDERCERIIKDAQARIYTTSDLFELIDILKNGTPLPKGHGRILDEKDILDTENNDGDWYDLVDMPEYIAGVKAIIEADTESEETE